MVVGQFGEIYPTVCPSWAPREGRRRRARAQVEGPQEWFNSYTASRSSLPEILVLPSIVCRVATLWEGKSIGWNVL